jgi:hypothetical protein
MSAAQFVLLAVTMLATPLAIFAIGCELDRVFLIDGSGALFGIDVVLLLWMRDQFFRAPEHAAIPVKAVAKDRA